MVTPTKKYSKFNQLMLSRHKQAELSPMSHKAVGLFCTNKTLCKTPMIYEPFICLVGQGEKVCHVGDSSFRYTAGDLFINVLPMPVNVEVTKASDAEPLVSASLSIDVVKLAEMVMRVERLQGISSAVPQKNTSSVMVVKASQEIFDAFVRLIQLASNQQDAQILADGVVDEIYYRLLTSEGSTALRLLLNQYGAIQPISRVVNHINENLDKAIRVSELSSIANMSKTVFFSAFKNLMHVSPAQYIKSIKLQKAKALLTQGVQAQEASFLVGYNSFSQFSREYKRFYGFSPSQTSVI